jgi:hypothetical protein
MIMNHTFKSLILVLAVLVSLGVMGQDNFKKGYVLTLENDTLFGKINDAGGFKNSKLCTFKPYKKHKVTEYLPGEIKGYRMIDDKYYVSKPVGDKEGTRYKFIEVLIEGPVSLYHDRKSTEKAFYLQKKDGDLVPLVYEVGQLRYKPEENIAVIYSPTYTVHNRIYQDNLYNFFSDSKLIQDRVAATDYDAKSLSDLTKDYIATKYHSLDAISYERNLKMYRPHVGIYGGIQLTDIEFLPSKAGKYSKAEPHSIIAKRFNTYPVGLFVNFPFPMLNDKLSFQLELQGNWMNYDEIFDHTQSLNEDTVAVSASTFAIPLMLKYDIFRGFITPSIGIGKSFNFVYDSDITGFGKEFTVIDESGVTVKSNELLLHPIQKGGWFGEAGISFKMSPGLSLFANARYTYLKSMIIERGLENASYNTLYDKMHYVKEFRTDYYTLLIGLKF